MTAPRRSRPVNWRSRVGRPRIALVVHGHRDGNHTGGRFAISDECAWRVCAAERAATRCGVDDVLLSGAGAPGGTSEAAQMASIWSVPGPRLWLDEASVDSAQNAAAALRWVRYLGARELLVVSSWWHIRLYIYYGGPAFKHLQVRHVRSRRCSRALRHLSHEVRYLPQAMRVGSSRLPPGPDARPSATGSGDPVDAHAQ